jgi:hypothetical protein
MARQPCVNDQPFILTHSTDFASDDPVGGENHEQRQMVTYRCALVVLSTVSSVAHVHNDDDTGRTVASLTDMLRLSSVEGRGIRNI